MATTNFRAGKYAGLVPARGTYPATADKLIIGGTIVSRDAAGRAVGATLNDGFNALGSAVADCDNRTTAPNGGGAGAENVEVDFGTWGWRINGTTPLVGQVLFVYDNETVTVDSNGGARGIAGYCVDVVGTVAYCQMGPAIVAQIVIAAAEAADLDQAQLDINTAEAAIDALEVDAATSHECLNIPLGAWRLNSGAAIPAFADASADGFALVDSEAVGIRWNDDGTAVLMTSVPIPLDLDASADVVFHAMGFRVGSSDTTMVLTIGAFFQTVGAAHTADANCGGNTTAFDGATTVVTNETLTLALADVPPAPAVLSLTLTPSAALDADDFVLLATWLEYTRAVQTA